MTIQLKMRNLYIRYIIPNVVYNRYITKCARHGNEEALT